MGKMQRDKGNRFERATVNAFKGLNIPARRVPLSGATDFAKGDVIVTLRGKDYQAECKARAAGFKQLYGWLEGNDLLIVKADRQPALMIMPVEEFCRLIQGKDVNVNEIQPC